MTWKPQVAAGVHTEVSTVGAGPPCLVLLMGVDRKLQDCLVTDDTTARCSDFCGTWDAFLQQVFMRTFFALMSLMAKCN